MGSSVLINFRSLNKTVDRVDFDGAHIAAGDLKAQIAARMKMPVEELVVSDSDGFEYERASHLIPAHTTVHIQRLPQWTKHRQAVLEVDTTAAKDLPEDAEAKADLPKPKRAVPPQFLCNLCAKPFWQPVLLGCCGESACTPCVARQDCPFCGKRIEGRPPNQALVSAMKVMLSREDLYEVEDSWRERFTYTQADTAAADAKKELGEKERREERKKEKKKRKEDREKDREAKKARTAPSIALPPLLTEEQYNLLLRSRKDSEPVRAR